MEFIFCGDREKGCYRERERQTVIRVIEMNKTGKGHKRYAGGGGVTI